MAMRPSSRISRNWAKPRPRAPSRWSSGTRHSTNVRPWVSEACQPILRYGGWTSKPGVPAGTTIVEISPGPVSAVTVTIDVIGVPELVMNDFSPSITHSPVVVERGPRPRAAGVAAGVGLGEPEAAERPPGAEVGQPALLLGRRAELVDRAGAEPDAGLQRDRQRLVGPGDLLDGHAEPGEVAAAAVGLGERDAEQAELAHRQHGVDGERVVAVPRLGVRLDLGVDELAHHGPQRLVLLGQLRMQRSSRPLSSPSAAATRGPAPARSCRRGQAPTGTTAAQRRSPATPHAATRASSPHSNAGGSTAGLNASWNACTNGFSGRTSPSVVQPRAAGPRSR